MHKGLLVLILALLAAAGLYFMTQQDEGSATRSDTVNYRAHIPADTLMFVVSETPIPLAYYTAADPNYAQVALMLDELESADEPALVFLSELGSRFLHAMTSGQDAMKSDWGFADEVTSAAYFVGVLPVMELSLAQPALFVAQVQQAADKAGLPLTTTASGEDKLHRVVLSDDDDLELTLLVRESQAGVRVAVETPVRDDLAALVSGDTLPAKSLASEGTVERITKMLDMRGDGVGALNLVALANTFTQADSLAGQMLGEVAPDFDLSGVQSPACADEIGRFVAGVPEWAFATDLKLNGTVSLVSEFASRLVIANAETSAQLAKLNGVVAPLSSVDVPRPLYSFALGLDVSQLTPVLMNLHSRIMAQDYKCEYMQEMKASLQESNPAMLGVATAMVSGIKGFSMTVNDLSITDMGEPESVSALVSVSAVSARQLLAMVQGFVPELASLSIPEDGTPVSFQSAMLPPSAPALKIAIKGDQHALIMTDDDVALKQAAAFDGLSLEPNGFMSMSLDLARISEVTDSVGALNPANGGLDATGCANMAMLQSSYENMQIKMDIDGNFNDKGFDMGGEVSQNIPKVEDFAIQPGKYQAYFIDDGCQPLTDSIEQFNADGTGRMLGLDYEFECELHTFESEYRWRQEGLIFYIDPVRSRSQDAALCDANAPWSEWEDDSESGSEACVITSVTEEGFDCVFDSLDEPFIYEFRAISP